MKLSDLFRVAYGHSLSLNKLTQVAPGDGIAFVSRTARNNGVAAWVEPLPEIQPLPAGSLTVCLRSRNYTLATFLQPRPFYTGFHIHVLEPLRRMGDPEKLWWARAIEANRFRYNFGRQANRTLPSLELPDEVPDWAKGASIPEIVSTSTEHYSCALEPSSWGVFGISDLFEVLRGRHVLRRDMVPGRTAYVSASSVNNGVSAWINAAPDYLGGQITIRTC